MIEFEQARWQLTLWYMVICVILLFSCTLAAIESERRAFSRIEQALSDKVQRPKLTTLLESRLNEFDAQFIRRLLVLDVALLAFAVLGSYLLSGLTLKPIQDMLKRQEDFAADASHELRTPLATVQMEVEVLKRLNRSLPEEVNDSLSVISSETSKMARLVESLLTFVRSGKVESTKEKLNVYRLAQDVTKAFVKIAEEKGLQLSVAGDETSEIVANTTQVKDLMAILLDNAVKYTHKGFVKLTVFKSGKYVVLNVSDTGPGISPQDAPHIFNRFYRSKAASASLERGSGLGLSIAKKIAASQGASISVETAVGKGSTFSVKFLGSS